MKRTIDNCRHIKRHGWPGQDSQGLCMGFGESVYSDEPCEVCKKCKLFTAYYDDRARQDGDTNG